MELHLMTDDVPSYKKPKEKSTASDAGIVQVTELDNEVVHKPVTTAPWKKKIPVSCRRSTSDAARMRRRNEQAHCHSEDSHQHHPLQHGLPAP